MKFKVFVDGQEGTTGLKIYEYLLKRSDIEILYIDPEKRKSTETRRLLLNKADAVFLCLPDDAAREAVSLVNNPGTRIIDASTAHRTNEKWAYGFPELNKNQRNLIRQSNRVAVPGCYATAFTSLIYPLISENIISESYPVTCTGISGYSGGGKKLIEKYENQASQNSLNCPSPYALKLTHKHVPEMQAVSKLTYPPVFTPIVANYFKGLVVSAPIFPRLMGAALTPAEVHKFFSSYYTGERFIRVMPFESDPYLDNGYLNIEACNNTNTIDIFIFGQDDRILLLARLDNLGKGASGAAIQNFNIMLGIDEVTGLESI